MRLKSLIIFLVLIVVLTGCSSSKIPVDVGEPAPIARLYMLNGESRSIHDYKGRDLILFFWASTCGHSHSVLEDLVSWQNSSPQARKTRVVSVSVDKADKEDKVREIISRLDKSKIEHGFSGNDIYDEAYVAFDIEDLPTLIAIDPQGNFKAAGSSVSDVTD